jgi:hypothetical protein
MQVHHRDMLLTENQEGVTIMLRFINNNQARSLIDKFWEGSRKLNTKDTKTVEFIRSFQIDSRHHGQF